MKQQTEQSAAAEKPGRSVQAAVSGESRRVRAGSQAEPPVTLAGRMRTRREELGLSLAEVAERAGCARSYVSCIENAKRAQPPSEGLLARLERALEFAGGELLLLARWQSTPGAVKEAMARLNDQQRAARRLVEVLRSAGGAASRAGAGPGGSDGGSISARGLDALHRSGELARLIERADPGGARPHEAQEGALGQPEMRTGASAGSTIDLAGDGTGADSVGMEALARVLPVEVPVINSVAAGYPAEFTDLGYPARVADDYVRTPDVRDPDAFAARVVGDSMSPQYLEGDIVVFSPARELDRPNPGSPERPGIDCFVRLEPDHETTFKRVYFERDTEGREVVRLQPLNPRYPARVVPREQVSGCYAAVSMTRVV